VIEFCFGFWILDVREPQPNDFGLQEFLSSQWFRKLNFGFDGFNVFSSGVQFDGELSLEGMSPDKNRQTIQTTRNGAMGL
jgi:hypothetical protein